MGRGNQHRGDGRRWRCRQRRDPIDARTAYLFTQFYTGTLSNYDYGAGRVTSANELQETFWYIEQEWSQLDGQAAIWAQEAADAIANNQWSGIGNVRVLNLYDAGHLGDNAYGRQDQLVMIAGPVPAPGAAVLALIGMGLSIRMRRRLA